jgi:hypothetical protein
MQSAAGLIDHAYRDSNMKYCDLMGVDESFFEPSVDAPLTRAEFLDVVRETAADRSNEAADDYRNSLLARLDGLRR